jgi:putative YhbY family RNA-binding protein
MLTITPARRRSLRADAHSLHPVVLIGQHGATAAVMHEIDVALLAHELIKVRVFEDDRAEREALLGRICEELACAPVQHIGKLLVLWRPNPEKQEAAKEERAPRAAAGGRRRKAVPRSTGKIAAERGVNAARERRRRRVT